MSPVIPDRESNAGPRLRRQGEMVCPTCDMSADRMEYRRCCVLACPNAACDLCVTKCGSCANPTCQTHLLPFDGDRLCPDCYGEQFEQMLTEFKEAV